MVELKPSFVLVGHSTGGGEVACYIGRHGTARVYSWRGERPLDPNAPRLDETGEIRLESAERASGYWTTRADTHSSVDVRMAGVYWRAEPEDVSILEGRDDEKRRELIRERLRQWKSVTKA